MKSAFGEVTSAAFVVTKTDADHGRLGGGLGERDFMESAVEEGEISGTESNGPTGIGSGEDIGRDLAKFVALVVFSAAILATTGTGEAAKDDGITDAAGF